MTLSLLFSGSLARSSKLYSLLSSLWFWSFSFLDARSREVGERNERFVLRIFLSPRLFLSPTTTFPYFLSLLSPFFFYSPFFASSRLRFSVFSLLTLTLGLVLIRYILSIYTYLFFFSPWSYLWLKSFFPVLRLSV